MSLVEERQTVADLAELSHAAVQLAQVLRVDLGEIGEIGFCLEFAFALELEELPGALLGLDHDGYQHERNVAFLLGVLVRDFPQARRQLIRPVVVNLRKAQNAESALNNKQLILHQHCCSSQQ